MAAFDFVVELSSFEYFYADVDGVLWLEHTVEFHKIFMIEFTHDVYFVD
jgi:hypothetical protein